MTSSRTFFILVHCFGIATPMIWYKSLSIGDNPWNTVLYRKAVRSQVECTLYCAQDANCRSFEYDTSSKVCTLLSETNQRGKFASVANLSHYSTSSQRGCPDKFDFLPNSKVCVKPFSNYMNWNDSRSACVRNGADLPVLNSDVYYDDFFNYMNNAPSIGQKLLHIEICIGYRNQIKKEINIFCNEEPDFRVAVNGFLINNIPRWSTGEVVENNTFCPNQPDKLNENNVCLFLAHKNEPWCCLTPINKFKLDDASCDDLVSRICMKKL